MTQIRFLLFFFLPGLLAVAQGSSPRTPVARTPGFPAIVFVSRNPAPAGSGIVPGLGPSGRTLVTGGRLLVRRANGKIEPLTPAGAFHDVSDPSVSWDGRRIAFAAATSPEGEWRIWIVNADGSNLTQVTHEGRAFQLARLGDQAERFRRFDDFDPCWLPSGRICFASTRYPQVAEVGGVSTSNLWMVSPDGGHLTRITSERNGAEEPTVDAETGRIVFARWWHNRHLASDEDPSGITLDHAHSLPANWVVLWHALTITPDGDGARIAGGYPLVRSEMMAYQPVVFGDGTLVGIRAEHTSLFPSKGPFVLRAFPGRFAEPIRLAGGDRASACSPAALADGRVLFSYDPRGDGDFGLYVVGRDGKRLHPVFDLPGTLELDAVPLIPPRQPPVLVEAQMDLPRSLPVTNEKELRDSVVTFRFDCLNVFANAGVDEPFPDAPTLDRDLRIRFYGALSRPTAEGGDTVILLRETPVNRSGAVHEHELPADTPMFEQLVDAHGHVLRTASGPAHVPGFNSGRFGHGTKCVGCHTGHSAIPVAESAHNGKWFNVSPSAEVSVSSVAEGNAGPRALVDRRARGPADQVGWVAKGSRDENVRLSWRWPIEVKTVVLYAIGPRASEGTSLRVQECEVTFFLQGQEVRRSLVKRELSPKGTRLEFEGLLADRMEVRPLRMTGTIHHRSAAALAEIETVARMDEN